MLTTNARWAAAAATMTVKELALHYGMTTTAVRKRNSRIDVQTLDDTYRTELLPMPEEFAERELGIPQMLLSRQLGVSVRTVRRWSAMVELELGVSARERWQNRLKAEYMAHWQQRSYSDAAKALGVSRKTLTGWAFECGARRPEDQVKRREAAKAQHAKRQPAPTSVASRLSWFGTPDLPVPRDLWVQAVRPSCPVWEMEEDDA